MWIQTYDGKLLNLNNVTYIQVMDLNISQIYNEENPWAIMWESEHTSGVIQRFPDRKQAEDALVRLFIKIKDVSNK